MDDSVREPIDGAPSLLRRLWLASQDWLIAGLGGCVPPMVVPPYDPGRPDRPADLTDSERRTWHDLETRLRATPGTTNHDPSVDR
ncbi:hypothetical protein OG836_04150 [Micromonospora zamorensis]|uniref:hypothetical protein n=1 Tax=Micromonospora zamorensis TaxID=709883 RepID=UPI000C17F771|nr:hypothetical protein [Micromonospora zamorensis]WSK49755.1 hypothetical protein OG423_04955 [Micromonospora zamorensis]